MTTGMSAPKVKEQKSYNIKAYNKLRAKFSVQSAANENFPVHPTMSIKAY